MKTLKISIILVLILLTVQGWTGDYVNLFAVFPSGPVTASFSGFSQALQAAGFGEVFHASLGFLLLATSVVILILSLRQKRKSLGITSILAFSAVVSAVAGGLLFVFSGFQADPNSAQMGGSFIGAYALFFLELYYTKE